MSFAGNAPSDSQTTRGTRAGSVFSNALGSALGSVLGGRGRRSTGGGTGTGGSSSGPARRGDRESHGRTYGSVGEALAARRGGATRMARAETDWARLGAFGAGIALGALVGAGAALLYAPQSGTATRAVLRRSARRATSRATDAWDELGSELRAVARRSRRKVKRGVTRGRWAAADLFDE